MGRSMKTYALYKVTNHDSGKAYIGCTLNLRQRMYAHRSVKAAWMQGNHTIEHLADAWDKNLAGIVEAWLIVEHKTLAPQGYNRMTGGFKGYKQHFLSIQLMKENRKKDYIRGTYIRDEKWRKNASDRAKKQFIESVHPFSGKKHTEETKKKIGAANKGNGAARVGIKMSDAARKAMSDARKSYFARMKAEDPNWKPTRSAESIEQGKIKQAEWRKANKEKVSETARATWEKRRANPNLVNGRPRKP